jgi:uncharacterized protein (DUF1697 family)
MNVGGHRITNDDLRAAFAAIGFEDVGVFRASGNVAFDGGDATDAQMTERIEQGLEAELGYAVPTFVRTGEELRAMAAEEPFPPDAVEAAKGKLQVDLLRRRPAKKDREATIALATDSDQLAFGDGAHLYWLPSGGTLESELDLKAIEKLCGLATRRTKGTIEQMAKKFF